MLLPRTNRGAEGRSASRHNASKPPQASPAGSRAASILSKLAVGIAALAAWTAPLQAGTVYLPNASFESPVVPPVSPYAYPYVDSWQQQEPPEWGPYQTGVFYNLASPDPTHLDNCDGAQAVFLFANPQTALFQDYDSTDWMNPTPTHAFGANFDVGKSYTLTVGVLGGTNLSYPMQEGTSLMLRLYYRDGSGNMVTVAATSITNSGTIFSNATHFVDFQAQLPTVKASDAWAGQHVGVQLLSTVTDTNLVGGYWDLDNVRLVSTVTPALFAPARTNGQFACTLQSEPGLRFEMLASTNLTLPLSNWTSLGTVTNVTGAMPFLDTATNLNRRFYRARQLP
jgi:hypothetical protein